MRLRSCNAALIVEASSNNSPLRCDAPGIAGGYTAATQQVTAALRLGGVAGHSGYNDERRAAPVLIRQIVRGSLMRLRSCNAVLIFKASSNNSLLRCSAPGIAGGYTNPWSNCGIAAHAIGTG
ncbi:hypothetical protein [Niabella beijingensis]|uniref:hypothetical protein n=1 Tax=Niabella beijingensis TaxID=2872700 RepID=UPI001CC12B05|nr:hypothetical protein [Niabella beijingensis]MBZ4190620.1 hypothetical protein [Niabella beijingensis]